MTRKDLLRFAFLMSDNESYNFLTIVSKIAQVVLYKENAFLSCSELCNRIDEQFGIEIAENELKQAILSHNDNFINSKKDNNTCYFLSNSAKNRIDSNQLRDTYENVIERFIIAKKSELNKFIDDDYSFGKIKKMLNDFFYFQINNNAINLLKILKNEFHEIADNDGELDNISKRVAIIFLEWDNPEKDMLVYNIINCSFEYCLLCLKDTNTPFKDMLNNKNFYLDTNVILSLIGINGPSRKKAALKFINRCKEFNVNIYYTNYTKNESLETLKRLVNSMDNSFNEDSLFIQDMYNEWLIKQSPTSGKKSFYKYLLSRINECLYDFKIDIIDQSFIKNNNVAINESVADLRAKKESVSGKVRLVNVVEHDVINYLYVVNKRPLNCSNVIDCKSLFITFDKILVSWGKTKSLGSPSPIVDANVVYGLILKFSSRTNDDLRSYNEFVGASISFLYDKNIGIEARKNIANAINKDFNLTQEQKKQVYLKATEIINDDIWVGETDFDEQKILDTAITETFKCENENLKDDIKKMSSAYQEEITATGKQMYENGKKEGEDNVLEIIARKKSNQKIAFYRIIYGLLIAAIIAALVFLVFSIINLVKENDKTKGVIELVCSIVGLLLSIPVVLIKKYLSNAWSLEEISLFKIDKEKIYIKTLSKVRKRYFKQSKTKTKNMVIKQ